MLVIGSPPGSSEMPVIVAEVSVEMHTGALVTVRVTPGEMKIMALNKTEVLISIGTTVLVTCAGQVGARFSITAEDATEKKIRQAGIR